MLARMMAARVGVDGMAGRAGGLVWALALALALVVRGGLAATPAQAQPVPPAGGDEPPPECSCLADLEVTVAQPGARVDFDGREVFVGPGTWKVRTAAGAHALDASAPGMASVHRDVLLASGATVRVELQLFTDTDTDWIVRKAMPRWVGYTVIGVGVDAAIVGGILHAGARSFDRDYDRQRAACAPAHVACVTDPALLSLRDRANHRRGAAYVLYGTGAGLAVLGGLIVWYEGTHHHRIGRRSVARLVPVVGREVAGVAALGRF
jgi:hypothetical protein